MTTPAPLDLDFLTYKQLSALSAKVYAAMSRAHAKELEKRDQTIADMKAVRAAQTGAVALALGLAKETPRLVAPTVAANGHARPKTRATASAKRPKVLKSLGTAPKRAMKIPVKFRDPDNPANTWTGRGRNPRWMKGRPKEQFAIAR